MTALLHRVLAVSPSGSRGMTFPVNTAGAQTADGSPSRGLATAAESAWPCRAATARCLAINVLVNGLFTADHSAPDDIYVQPGSLRPVPRATG